jgi:hypothetical protein
MTVSATGIDECRPRSAINPPTIPRRLFRRARVPQVHSARGATEARTFPPAGPRIPEPRGYRIQTPDAGATRQIRQVSKPTRLRCRSVRATQGTLTAARSSRLSVQGTRSRANWKQARARARIIQPASSVRRRPVAEATLASHAFMRTRAPRVPPSIMCRRRVPTGPAGSESPIRASLFGHPQGCRTAITDQVLRANPRPTDFDPSSERDD